MISDEIKMYGYRPRRTWRTNKDGKRVVWWMALAPDAQGGGSWYHGFEDSHIAGDFSTKAEAAECCRLHNIDNWGVAE